jgi:hypothetical protein
LVCFGNDACRRCNQSGNIGHGLRNDHGIVGLCQVAEFLVIPNFTGGVATLGGLAHFSCLGNRFRRSCSPTHSGGPLSVGGFIRISSPDKQIGKNSRNMLKIKYGVSEDPLRYDRMRWFNLRQTVNMDRVNGAGEINRGHCE